jgi:glycosyltransferase involved in cell wall biosynthesis
MDASKILTIIVPVYNEQETIISILESLQRNLYSIPNVQVFVVDDASSDETNFLLNEHPDLYNELIILEKNSGKGKAVIKGLEKISGGAVLVQDADLEYNPREIPRLWDHYLNNNAQLLMSSRLAGSEITRIHYFWHRIGNRIITLLFNIINNTTFTDVYSGYIMFDRNLLDISKLRVKRWGQQAEILTILVKKSNRIFETPISYYGREYSEGKKIRPTSIFSVLITIFVTKLRVI